MAGEEEDHLIARPSVEEQPFQPFPDRCLGGPLVHAEADLLRLETAFLQRLAHGEDVVDAAAKRLLAVRILGNTNQKRLAHRLVPDAGLVIPPSPFQVARAHDANRPVVLAPRQRAPKSGGCTAVGQVAGRAMMHVSIVELRLDLQEVVHALHGHRLGEDAVPGVKEVDPAMDGEPRDPAVGQVAADERIGELGAQRHVPHTLHDLLHLGIRQRILVGERIVGEQGAKAMGEQHGGLNVPDAAQDECPCVQLELLVLQPGRHVAHMHLREVGDDVRTPRAPEGTQQVAARQIAHRAHRFDDVDGNVRKLPVIGDELEMHVARRKDRLHGRFPVLYPGVVGMAAQAVDP